MAYDRVRSRNDLSAAILTATSAKLGTFTASSGIRNLGTEQNMLDIGGTKYKPGRFKIAPVSIRKFSATCTTGELVFTAKNNYFAPWSLTYKGMIAALPPAPSYDIVNGIVLPSDVYLDSAIASSFAKMNQPDMDMGPFLAEMNQTIKMIHEPLKTLVGLAKGLKRPRTVLKKIVRKRKPTVRRIAREIQDKTSYASNAWLQLRYGICPLISDINGLIKVHKAGTKASDNILCRESGGVTVSHSSGTFKQSYADGNFTTDWESVWYKALKVSSTVYFERRIEGRDLGSDVLDLPSLIWELIPYSFVVDWAFGVGNWIRSVQPKPDRVYLGNTISVKEVTSWTRRNTRAYITGYGPSTFPVTPTSSIYGCSVEKLRRSINRQIPVLPVLNVDCLNIQRSLDSLSLTWQKMPKIKR